MRARHMGRDRLGAVTAARIESDVMRAGWPVGMILGSEAQLLDRYGVSRPTLREVIRLLEHRQIVSMRRGPGGGLSVTAPDSSAVAGAAIAYLEFAHVNVQDLVESL